MEKEVLVCVIVVSTVCFVTIWISVDFCIYRKRKREVREKHIFMFYNYGKRRRLAFPHSKEAIGLTKSEKPFKKTSKTWRRLLRLFQRQKTIQILKQQGYTVYQNGGNPSGERDWVYDKNPSQNKLKLNTNKKRNSITPSELLTPNRMALSPMEMSSVFNTDSLSDDFLFTPDIHQQSVPNNDSSFRQECVEIENETGTMSLTKWTN